MEYALTATKTEARAGSYYDRIARFYDLTFKVNGYPALNMVQVVPH